MKKLQTNHWVLVGKIGRPHGIKGFVKIHSLTEPATNIIKYLPWYDNNKKSLAVLKCEKLGNKVIALFDEKEKPDVNTELWIERNQLPPLKEHEYYWTDLIGLNVYNQENQYLGEVTEIFNTGANDIMSVENKEDRKKILIPFLFNNYIIKIDLAEKIMRVDWHED
ncbi:MAG: ribosome maturation factor RimM [Gammaproteobacteria bacterium]|nr:ribosome maturation factor RimM [Gammaproteobacteria bacterium]